MNKSRVFVFLAMGVILLFGSVSLVGATLIIEEDFNTPVAGFAFNGNASQDLPSGTAVLTQAAGNQAGSMYSTTAIHVEQFVATFDFAFSQAGGFLGGGDGIVFAVLAPPSGPSTLGYGGANFGWGPAATGFAIEFDTYNDQAYYVPVEINDNHVGLDVNGAISGGSTAVAPVPVPMKNGGWFSATVAFNDGTVNVFLENASLGLPETLLLSATIPSFTAFEGYMGFAGGTGAAIARQEVDNFRVNAPVPEPAALLVVAPWVAWMGARAWRRYRTS